MPAGRAQRHRYSLHTINLSSLCFLANIEATKLAFVCIIAHEGQSEPEKGLPRDQSQKGK